MTKNVLKKRLINCLILVFLFHLKMDVFAQDYIVEDIYREQAAADSRDELSDTSRKIRSLKKNLEDLNSENINLKEENRFLRDSLKIAREESKNGKKNTSGKPDAKQPDVSEGLKKEVENLKESLADAVHKLAEIYTQKKLYKEAIDAYKKALYYNPNNGQSCFHLGLLYAYVEKNPKEALVYLHKYLKLAAEEKNKKKAAKIIKLLE